MALRDRLIGTFTLISLETRRTDGHRSQGFGAHPVGVFMFDGDGWFSVQLMDPDVYPAAGSFVAMFGKYTVDEAAQTFTLRPIGAHDPALIGADVLRHVTFENDLAVFRTPTHMSDGVEATTTITWRPGSVHPQA